MTTLDVVSLFSGIGGFDTAMERAGMRVVAQVEKDAACRAMLKRHWPEVLLMEDVQDAGGENLPPADVVCGGSPCQAFSVAGLRGSLSDARGNLAFEFVRVAHELRPRWIVWENVPGVLSTRDNAFGCFLAALVGSDAPLVPAKGQRWTNAGLVVGPERAAAWRILDAQYFGLAQRRRRLFVVAGATAERVCQVLFERQSSGGHTAPRREQGQKLAAEVTASPGNASGDVTILDGQNAAVVAQVGSITSGAAHHNRGFMVATPQGAGNRALTSSNHRLDGDTDNFVVAGPLTSGAGTERVGGNWNEADPGGGGRSHSRSIAGGFGVRRLTSIECERLQGFNDNWTEGQSDSTRYRQIGNAVAVPVVEWIARRIVELESSI